RPDSATRPSSTRFLRRVRDKPSTWAASTRSSRSPASVSATSTLSLRSSCVMSDPDPDDPSNPAAKRPTRSFEASRRLSQLLSRPFGPPAAPGETVDPLPRVVRPAPVPEAAPAPPDHTASPLPPPAAAAADPEPHLPWFDRPG